MMEMLTDADSQVKTLMSRMMSALTDSDLVDIVHTGIQLASQWQTATAVAAHELKDRSWPKRQGSTSLATWLRDDSRISIHTARRLTALGDLLDERDTLREAVTSGNVNAEQATVIGKTIASMATEDVPSNILDTCERTLIGYATDFDPNRLTILADRALNHAAPDLADQVIQRRLERAERKATETRSLTLTPDGPSRVRISGYLPTEAAAIIREVLESLITPRRTGNRHTAKNPNRATRDNAARDNTAGNGTAPSSRTAGSSCSSSTSSMPTGNDNLDSSTTASRTRGNHTTGNSTVGSTVGDHSADATACRSRAISDDGTHNDRTDREATDRDETDMSIDLGTESAADTITGSAADMDQRTPAQRRADALTDVFRLHLAEVDLPCKGGRRPRLTLTINYDILTKQLGTATLDTGEKLTPATARRLACDADILPAIMNSDSTVLDLGRSRRLFSGRLRRAITLRDQGCAFPHCDRGPRWCQAHHITPWQDGGTTSLRNAMLVCSFHHHVLHEPDTWRVRIASDGRPEFIPPRHLDPVQTPRRNTVHHT